MIFGFSPGVAKEASSPDFMPRPAKMQSGAGRLAVTAAFAIAIRHHDDARLRKGIERLSSRWQARTGLTFSSGPANGKASETLMIDCAETGSELPALGDDESYTLDITAHGGVLRAATVVGALRGLETLAQLLESDGGKWFLPAVSIQDAPRFPWRGLMLDVCRHWQPIEVVKRTLDGMAAVKLNVLHLHLSEDQGFRIESRKFPRLQELGSDGKFFTQKQIREIVAYAAERGIRVVPEFDMPGHATSWLTGYPELGSAPGPYAIERKWGIFEPVFDPANEAVYAFLDGFLGEMAGLFPDLYFHIGGDEVKGGDWDKNPRIRAFMKERGLKDHAALQAYFNRRVQAILTKYGKRMVGWDEILHDDLPRDAVIQSWRGPDALAAAARRGYSGLLSNGYYIDLAQPAAAHYPNDPIPANTTLTLEEQKRILGGEATMWSEWVTPETIDSRIWPRTASIAERLWSPRDARDLDDMYRRLAIVSGRLAEIGLRHESYIDPLLRRLAGDSAPAGALRNLRVIADLVEPVEAYQRGKQQPGSTQGTPLTGLVDCARPDSALSREFSREVDRDDLAAVAASLGTWKSAADDLARDKASARVRALKPLFDRIGEACAIGLEAVAQLRNPAGISKDWRAEKLAALADAARPHDACKLPFIPALRRLVVAAAEESKRAGMTPEAWPNRVETQAVP